MITSCEAKAKIVTSSKLKGMGQLIVAFNVRETREGKYVFPRQPECDYVSGHFALADMESEVERLYARALQVLRTDRIVFVG